MQGFYLQYSLQTRGFPVVMESVEYHSIRSGII